VAKALLGLLAMVWRQSSKSYPGFFERKNQDRGYPGFFSRKKTRIEALQGFWWRKNQDSRAFISMRKFVT
jgi:hypothetical protein